jgi:hypothetical protein
MGGGKSAPKNMMNVHPKKNVVVLIRIILESFIIGTSTLKDKQTNIERLKHYLLIVITPEQKLTFIKLTV